MRSFDGFKRRAVVIVPADDEFQRRVAKREAEEGKDVPDSAVLEMKGVCFCFFVCVLGLVNCIWGSLIFLFNVRWDYLKAKLDVQKWLILGL